MTTPAVDKASGDEERKGSRYDFDQHAPRYRQEFEAVTTRMRERCPVAWSATYGGHFLIEDSLTGNKAGPLLDPATEEFLRFFTPAPGDGRTITADCVPAGQEFRRGDRVRVSWHVLDRIPGYAVDPAATVHYPTIGVIQGMRHLAATFTPGRRRGPGLAETIDAMQRLADERGLAAPVTSRQ